MERGAQIETKAPFDLAKRLAHLHDELPEPPIPEALGDAKPNISWSLSADIWEACHAYEQALRSMTAPTSPLDDRLRAVYGRLHVQAIKIAILLSALDCADTDKSSKQPKVTREHWYRAQTITETWRASAHRLLADLGENEEMRLEQRILGLLRTAGSSATVRDLYRALRSTRKPVIEALKALEQDGLVFKVDLPIKPGVRSETYRLSDDLVNLAVTIRDDGQVNPLTVVDMTEGVTRLYRIETGERRYWATWILRDCIPGYEHDGMIDCIIVPSEKSSIFRQAKENTARKGLSAIAMARQTALLLLTVHGYEIPLHAVDNDFYRQALDLDLRGKREYTEAILNAMGGIDRARFSQYKA